MQWKTPKNTDKYQWTAHVSEKMHYYGLSEQKVLGVIRRPQRIETSIVENTVAVMMPVGNIKKGPIKPRWGRPSFASAESSAGKPVDTWNQEIWVLYQTKSQEKKFKDKTLGEKKSEKIAKLQRQINASKQITIISAWRYPGVSPKNNPIPEEILREIEEISL
jgi:hypothetical protein